MKKASLFLLGIIIGAFVTYFFCPRQAAKLKEQPIVKPKGVITVEKAKELNTNWTLHRKKAVDSAAAKQGRKQDDRSVWWSLDDVENYVAYAKSESQRLGYDMNGIRVYLGVYGKNAGQTKKDLTTMFLVPTGNVSKSQASSIVLPPTDDDLPIDPLNDGTGSGNGYPK